MKLFKHLMTSLSIIALLFVGSACSEDDPVEPKVDPPGTSKTELLSKKVTTGPTVDGNIDASWALCNTLTGTAAVISAGDDANKPGKDVFEYFVGEKTTFTMRSMYDATKVYFLIEWADDKDSKDRESWYFDATTKLWEQQNKYPTSANDKYYEDKIGVMWDINGVAGWDQSTCFITCHMNLDLATEGGGKSARHYTKNDGELVDTWHWKRVRNVGQLDDKHMVHSLIGKGRVGDTKTGGGYSNNKQTLNNGTADVSVPKYVIIPEPAEQYYWITQIQIDDGTAKLITAVDADGVLTYDGGTINPADGGYEEGTGTKRLPSVTIAPFEGPRGDVAAEKTYTGTGWVLEISRNLTNDTPDEDVQFDVANDYMFGLAIFNNSAIAHQIKPNLTFKFDK